MKIILLNYKDECVEVCPVSPEEEKEFDKDNFDLEEFLSKRGYDTDNCHWMACYGDPDDVPVFWGNEDIPYTHI